MTASERTGASATTPNWIFYRFDDEGRVFREALAFDSAGSGAADEPPSDGLTFKLGEERGLVGLVAARAEPLSVPDVHADPRWLEDGSSTQSAYLTPVRADAQALGVLVVTSADVDGIDAGHKALADALAAERARVWQFDHGAHVQATAKRLDLSVLSQRERDVVNALCRGLRLTDIARVLGISNHTARNHLKHVFRKLGVHSQVELLSSLGRPRGAP